MLAPRFSIRRLLLIMTFCGVCFLIFSMAVRGHEWAQSFSFAGLSLILLFSVFRDIFLCGVDRSFAAC